ncbi:MAG: hypothetical protein GX589_06440 [Deltaproteobacteria bacterium]|jgi:hypothetical protein|nr:hypothetical protein [Deltaproteobacteria bacterium]
MTGLSGLSAVQRFFKGGGLERFIPEPTSRMGSGFRNALRAAQSAASAVDSSLSGITGEMGELLARQKELQEEMMKISLISNIMRTEHETKMAAVRNLRVA